MPLEESSGDPGNGQASRAGAGAAAPAPCKRELGELSLVCHQGQAARGGLVGGAASPRWGGHGRGTPTREGRRYTSGGTSNPQQTTVFSSPSAAPVASPPPLLPLGSSPVAQAICSSPALLPLHTAAALAALLPRGEGVQDSPDVGGDNMSLSHVSAMSCGSERGIKASSSVARCALERCLHCFQSHTSVGCIVFTLVLATHILKEGDVL